MCVGLGFFHVQMPVGGEIIKWYISDVIHYSTKRFLLV